MMRVSALAMLLVACTTTEDPWPDKLVPDRLPDDPRHGDRLDGIIYVGAATITGTHTYVVGQTPDLAFHPYELVLSASPPVLRALPPAPFPLEPFRAGITIGSEGWTFQGAFFDGTAWTEIPADPESPQPVVVIARSATQVIHERLDGSDPTIVGRYWNGSTWQSLQVPAVYDSAIGPWDDRGARVVWSTETDLCTAIMALDTLTLGAPACVASSFGQIGSALNGSVDDFVVDASGALFHITGSTLERGDSVAIEENSVGGLELTPGQPGAILRRPNEIDWSSGAPIFSSASYIDVSDGHLGQVLLPGFPQYLACTCDRASDPSCPCVARELSAVLTVSPARDEAVMTTVDRVDGQERAYVRVIELPAAGSPLFAFP